MADDGVDLAYRLFDAESALAELVAAHDGPPDPARMELAWSRARAVLEQIPSSSGEKA